ncbi:hypothetical protein IWX90DRAFT_138184 [Phyllosticta citrichinensis]|uniref:Uncharacterized protein n=1 Tax=Phyllosticta citrichinensis TaxID=1130410 RepID=A0ABR1XYH2_9PEZI
MSHWSRPCNWANRPTCSCGEPAQRLVWLRAITLVDYCILFSSRALTSATVFNNLPMCLRARWANLNAEAPSDRLESLCWTGHWRQKFALHTVLFLWDHSYSTTDRYTSTRTIETYDKHLTRRCWSVISTLLLRRCSFMCNQRLASAPALSLPPQRDAPTGWPRVDACNTRLFFSCQKRACPVHVGSSSSSPARRLKHPTDDHDGLPVAASHYTLSHH